MKADSGSRAKRHVDEPECELPKEDESAERCSYQDGEFEVSARGVFFVKIVGENDKRVFVCSELRVTAKTRDPASSNWGRHLVWLDDDGIEHTLAVPLERLEGDGVELRKELANKGVKISQQRQARDLLCAYIKEWPTKKRARSVSQLGWLGDAFVTPTSTIGNVGDEVITYQSVHAIEPAMSVCGSVEDWVATVAAYACGNTRLVFAISAAFAAPLVKYSGGESGGLHLRGPSSTGKSTALRAAASVYGNPSTFTREWRSTSNGLEGIAALHNDLLLVLDEISQADPKEVGTTAYLLANGVGKSRAGRDGNARDVKRWRTLFLSAGEESLQSAMLQAGKRPKAGQEVRLADIDIGSFETLHKFDSPNALAQGISAAAKASYGSVGIRWLHLLVADSSTLESFIKDAIDQFIAAHVAGNASGQVLRVARRFALVAAAGELASYYGATGWNEGESTRAAAACFENWLTNFGGADGSHEERAILDKVRSFFEAHGSSRFQTSDNIDGRAIYSRAGFLSDGRYCVFTKTFREEVCRGFDHKHVRTVLTARGWLVFGNEDPPRATQNLPGPDGRKHRVYVFKNSLDTDS